jgi:hypothetical protein
MMQLSEVFRRDPILARSIRRWELPIAAGCNRRLGLAWAAKIHRRIWDSAVAATHNAELRNYIFFDRF